MIHVGAIKGFSKEGLAIVKEKTAVLDFLLAGAALHVVANMATKAVHKTEAGKRLQKGQMAAGIQSGMHGETVSPIAKGVVKTLAGPEWMMPRSMGERLGTSLRGLSKGRQRRVMKKLRKGLASTEYLKDAPHLKSLTGALTRVLDGKARSVLPTVPVASASRTGSAIGRAAASVGIGAAASHVLPHAALSLVRETLAKSTTGKKFMKEQAKKGLKGIPLSRAVETTVDLGLSPAALDPRRLGAALRKEYMANPDKATKVLMSLGGISESIPGAGGVIKRHAPEISKKIILKVMGESPQYEKLIRRVGVGKAIKILTEATSNPKIRKGALRALSLLRRAH